MAIDLPPPPPTTAEAVAAANRLAYGFEKHKDVSYWDRGVGYKGDPDYYWKRMLGWQAAGADVAHFGLYAVPPSAWNGPVVVPVPPPVLVPPPDVGERLDALEKRLAGLETRLTAHLIKIEDVQQRGLTGKALGYTVVLKP